MDKWNLFFNAISTLATCILAWIGYQGLNSWNQTLKYEKEKTRIEKLRELSQIILQLDDIYSRLNPSYTEIPPLMKKFDDIRFYIRSCDYEFKNLFENLYGDYSLLHYYLKCISKNKQQTFDDFEAMVKILTNRIPENSMKIKTLIEKELS